MIKKYVFFAPTGPIELDPVDFLLWHKCNYGHINLIEFNFEYLPSKEDFDAMKRFEY